MNYYSNLIIYIFFLFFVSCETKKVYPLEQYYVVEKPNLEDPGFPLQHELDSMLYKSIILKVGTLSIKSYGVCYGLKENPSVKKDIVSFAKTPIDSIPFIFENKLKNLKIGTIYQIRTFLITSKDTLYGPNNYFRTIGKNEWFTRDLVPYPASESVNQKQITTFFDNNKLFLNYQNENLFWEYDTQKYIWIKRKEIPSTINGKSSKYSFMINGKAYCGNLLNTNTKLENEFWEYDVKNDNWKNLEAIKPNLKSETSFGFSIGNFGYVLNQSKNNSWNFWQFDSKNQIWKEMNEYFKNHKILNMFSNGQVAFVILSNNEIHKFENGEFKYFMSIDKLFVNNGSFGYFGGILNDKLILGEFTLKSVDGKTEVATKDSKSININTTEIDNLIETSFTNYFGAIQTTNRLFFVSYDFKNGKQKNILNEYFSK